MIINGFIERDKFYNLITEKLKSLGISEKDYPLNSKKIAQLYSPNLELEFINFKSINIGGILYKDPLKSYMALNSSRSKKGQNFDCMHELIHYWFHPYTEYFCSDKKRKHVQNKDFEWQANEGAAQALMPKDLFIQKYKDFKGEISALSDFFFVGEKAIVYRMLNLNLHDMFIFLEDINRNILKNYKTRICPICKNPKIDINSNYCTICGQYLDTLIIKGDDIMIYDGHDLDNNMKLKICQKCLNTNISNNDEYCRICGQYLCNDCSNNFCGVTKLSGDIRICPQCGSSTTFLNSGILKNWQDSLEFQFNKLEYEENLCGENGNVTEIEDWSFLSYSFSNKGKVYLSSLLEHTTAKQCGNTLVIYTPNNIIKDKLNTNRNLEIIMNNLNSELGIEVNSIEIVNLEGFQPNHQTDDSNDIEDFEIPF